MSTTRSFCAALLLVAAALLPAGAQPPPAFKAVLVAGDGSLPVFDNAVGAVGRRLAPGGGAWPGVERLSSSGPRMAGRSRPATLDRVLGAVAAMHPAPGQGCLVFATSHGVQHEGFYLSLRDEVLTPRALDRALVQGCGAAPTAVVVSSCFSGSFAQPPMNRANRVVLTAARPDRTSFGCQAGRVFTVYDKCLIDALDHEHTWQQAYLSIKGCVGTEERREDAVPSEPQAWFGAAVAGMTLPARAAR